jgi:glyoxylase-like metal-dependent hydrolase (beta-lactamase superfamily II)/rhodanese-related sulfurtransferase
MIFRQFIHDDLGCGSYLVGDEHAGVAAIVDPKLEIEDYLALARYMGVRIEHVLETHNHADHVSGHGRLAAATGATIHIHRLAHPDYEHEPFDDGWELELGTVTVRALHTPGHRPEHTAFALIENSRGADPWAVLSGDSLFVGDIARPDLAVEKEDGAHEIFHSLHDKLLALPGECEVWPAHVGGSLCGGPGMDMKVSSTIAYELRHNRLLALADEDAFVRETTSGLGPQPPNFQAIVAINRGPLITEGFRANVLTASEVQRRQAEGGLVVDTRAEVEYDRGHIPGALCNPALRAGFGTKLAWIADRDREVVLVGDGDADAAQAGQLAGSVGIRKIAGYLGGGMSSWTERGLPVQELERIDVEALHDRRDKVQVLDVRERPEFEAAHIPGSIHVSYHDVTGIPEGIDPGRAIAVICSSGQRSAVAASLLLAHGAEHVIHVAGGGVGTWQQRGWEVTQTEAPAAIGG